MFSNVQGGEPGLGTNMATAKPKNMLLPSGAQTTADHVTPLAMPPDH